jgi:hypothetical protein
MGGFAQSVGWLGLALMPLLFLVFVSMGLWQGYRSAFLK